MPLSFRSVAPPEVASQPLYAPTASEELAMVPTCTLRSSWPCGGAEGYPGEDVMRTMEYIEKAATAVHAVQNNTGSQTRHSHADVDSRGGFAWRGPRDSR